MRRLAIFLFFLCTVTLSLHMGDFMAFLYNLFVFIILYHLAEEVDELHLDANIPLKDVDRRKEL